MFDKPTFCIFSKSRYGLLILWTQCLGRHFFREDNLGHRISLWYRLDKVETFAKLDLSFLKCLWYGLHVDDALLEICRLTSKASTSSNRFVLCLLSSLSFSMTESKINLDYGNAFSLTTSWYSTTYVDFLYLEIYWYL